MTFTFQQAKRFLTYGSKQSKYCFHQQLQNRLVYINVNAIFEFLGQFTLRYNTILEKSVDNFELEHKACKFLVKDVVPP